jgi:hypothetical protein
MPYEVLVLKADAQLEEICAQVKINEKTADMPQTGNGRPSCAAAHQARVAAQAEAFLQRRAHGTTHPVWDFLFTYYSFSPAKLMTWVPGIQTEKAENGKLTAAAWDGPPMTSRILREAQWIATLCSNVMSKPPRLTCHGLHEWAMVYRQSAENLRHRGYKLRLAPDELARFVESQSICCTHYDAYRFFTDEALPLNTLKPRFETRLDMEQSGCLHVNMDLYKWAYKLWPWIGSDLVADAFEVAVAAREFDMRASPYDLAELGFAPIRIETPEGREDYRREQQRLMEMAGPVRENLRTASLDLLELASADQMLHKRP